MEKTMKDLRQIVHEDNAKEVFIIIERFPEIDYTLVYRNSSYQPWVAAWGLNEEKQYWQQGHYFMIFADAVEYIHELTERSKGK